MSAPSVVTKRVVSPARSALCTTLAAAVTARSNASSPAAPGGDVLVEHDEAAAQALDGVLADLEVLRAGRGPPVDRARLVAVDVVAQAVEVARPEALGERQQVAAEHALAERRHVQQVGPRRHEHLVDAGHGRDRAGQSEHVVAHGGQRADRQHATALGRDAVAGADLGRRRRAAPRPCGRCGWRPTGSTSSKPGERPMPTRCTSTSTRPTSPAVSTDGRIQRWTSTRGRRTPHREPGEQGGDGEGGADDEQLEDAEQPADDDGHDGRDEHHPPLAGQPGGHGRSARDVACRHRAPASAISATSARGRRRGSRRWRRRDRAGRRGRCAAAGGG